MHRKGVLVPSTLFTDTCSLVFFSKDSSTRIQSSYGKFDPISYFIYKITLQSQALMMMSQSTLEPSYKARVLECLRRSFQLDALPCLQVWGVQ